MYNTRKSKQPQHSPLNDAEVYVRTGQDQYGFERNFIDDIIGYGIFATTEFSPGDFLLEYVGDLIEPSVADEIADQTYVYYFSWASTNYSIDASTSHEHRLGRFVNDSPKRFANCAPKVKFIDGKPRVLLFATKHITVGTEIRYDYAGGNLPWRKNSQTAHPVRLPGSVSSGSPHTERSLLETALPLPPSNCWPPGSVSSVPPPAERSPESALPLQLSNCCPPESVPPVSPPAEGSQPETEVASSDCWPPGSVLSDSPPAECSLLEKVIPVQPSNCWLPRSISPVSPPTERSQLETALPLPPTNCRPSGTSLSVSPLPTSEWFPPGAVVSSPLACMRNDCDRTLQFDYGCSITGMAVVDHNQNMIDVDQPFECVDDSVESIEIEYPPDLSKFLRDESNSHCWPPGSVSSVPPPAEHSPPETALLLQPSNCWPPESAPSVSSPTQRSLPEKVLPLQPSMCTSQSSTSCDNPGFSGIITGTNDAEDGDTVPTTSVIDNAELNRPKMYVKCSSNVNGKRVFDKKHYCLYCSRSSTNLTKHLLNKHKDEERIKQIMMQTKMSDERKLLLELVRNLGDYKHNCDVRSKGEGEIIAWRSPPECVAAEEYVPCPDCYAFFQQKLLWRHHKECAFCRRSGKKHMFRSLKSEADLLLPSTHEVSSGLKEHVLTMMKRDEFSILARNDQLITLYGEKLFQKHGHLKHLHHHISCKMRELSRLVTAARKLDSTVMWLADCLCPENFNMVSKAVKELCGFAQAANKYKTPSLALKLGHSLKKCCAIAICSSIKENDAVKRKTLEDFMYLCDKEWSSEVSSAALSTLASAKMNEPQPIPLTSDIQKLNQYIATESKKCQVQMESDTNVESWQTLARVTLVSMVLFNRRRSGESERLLLSEYNKRSKDNLSVKDIADSLSEVERVICRTMSRVEIRGKHGRTVPVILTPQMVRAIDLLNCKRHTVGISEANPYVFARPLTSTPLRASECLHKLAVDCGAACPENLTSTRLRKHIATTSQILNLQECDLDILAGFLGHNIHVHRNFYRLPQETLQLAKVSKILLAYDSGQIASYKGKNLDEIELNDMVETDSSEDLSDTGEDDKSKRSQSKDKLKGQPPSKSPLFTHAKRQRTKIVSDDDEDWVPRTSNSDKLKGQPPSKSPLFTHAKRQRTKIVSDDDEDWVPRTSNSVIAGHNNESGDEKSDECDNTKVRKKTRRRVVRRAWTTEERDAVSRHFSEHLMVRRVPRKDECVQCIETEPCLVNRDWKAVKFFVHTAVQKNKRVLGCQ